MSLPVIGTANLDLLSRSGLLNVDLKGSILGDTHLGIAEITSIESLNYKDNYFGLINADIINPILGEDHIGAWIFHQIETAEGTTVSGGLVIADLNDSLLGDAHIGVGEFGSLDPPNPSVPTENPTGEIPIQNKPSSPGKPARPPDLNNTGINQGNISVEDKSTQYFSSFDESMQSADRLAPVAELSAVLTNAGNKDGSHQQSEKELASLKKLAEANVNGLTNSVIQMALLQNAPSGNSSSSGSGSGSSSSGSGGSGADSILDSAYDAELGIETNVQIILQEMADEWIKAPPIKPPQATFFLS